MKTAFRLSVLVLLLVLGVLPGAWRGSGPAIAEDSGQLNVVDWPGFDGEEFSIDFKEKYPKVAVNFITQPNDAAIYSYIKLGNQADIIHPYSSWLRRWVEEGLVEEIDVTKLENWDKVPDVLKELGSFDGKQYFVPWDVGFSSILYRIDKVTEPIESWTELFNPHYKGHISMFDDGPSAVSVSAYIKGWKETEITPDRLKVVKDDWIQQRKLNAAYWEDEGTLIQDMTDGRVWIAYAWPSAYAALKENGIEVEYANPKEGRASWVGFYGILKGTKDPDLALKFLDEKLATKTAENVIKWLNYGVANQEVWSSSSNPTLKQLSLDDPSVLQQTKFTPELPGKQLDEWLNTWNDVKAAP